MPLLNDLALEGGIEDGGLCIRHVGCVETRVMAYNVNTESQYIPATPLHNKSVFLL